MAPNDLWKRYLDAGLEFTQTTQARAEAIVRDLVRAGEVQAEQTQALVNEMVERSRHNTERLVETIRNEVRNQMALAETASKEMLDRLEVQMAELRAQVTSRGRPVKKAAKKAAKPAKKKAPKKAAKGEGKKNGKGGKKAAKKKATAQKAAKNKA